MLPAELEAVTVKVAMAVTAVGFPLITPVMVLRHQACRKGRTYTVRGHRPAARWWGCSA